LFFTVTTWSLSRLSMEAEPMEEWVKDGVLECEELWALPAYQQAGLLPPVKLELPFVSSDDPDVICFMHGVRPRYDEGGMDGGGGQRRKAVLSVVPL
jgi:hypothetical protein